MKVLVIGLLTLTLPACTMDGSVADEQPKTMECKDTRDGEVFRFDSSTVRDVRIGILGAESCLTLTDSDGATRTLCEKAAQFIKCKELTS
jgi:hypothetical protein